MTIAAYKTAIKTWLEAQSGLTVQWRDESGGWQAKPRIRAHLSAGEGKGIDWLSWAQDTGLAAGSDFVPTVNGNRELLLSIVCETRDQTDPALGYLEKVRTSCLKPSVKAVLSAAGLVAYGTERTLDLSQWVDDRYESVAQLDVRLSAVVQDRDEAEADSYVDHYTATGALTTPADEDAGPGEDEYS